MPSSFFTEQLVFSPFKQVNTQACILFFDASTLDISQYDLPALLSEFELNVINRRKSAKAKQEYLATRLLLKYLVKLNTTEFKNIPTNHISSEFDEKTSKLLIHIMGSETVFSSCLSHSNGFVGAALNLERVEFGFDIEKISLKRPFKKLAKHFYHADEVNLITANEQHSAERFFRIWTLKEALAKATSRPIAKLLSPNVFTELSQTQLTAKSTEYQGFDISVISKNTGWQCVHVDDINTVLAFE